MRGKLDTIIHDLFSCGLIKGVASGEGGHIKGDHFIAETP